MSAFVEMVDSYCERYEVDGWDRGKLLAHYPLFKAAWLAEYGRGTARALSRALMARMRNYELRHSVAGPGGRRLPVPIRFHADDLASFREIFFGDEYRTPLDVSTARTYVDLGANTGMAALWFASRAALQKVVLVEANPDLLEQLWRNVRPAVGNALVVIENRAVVGSPAPGGVRFFVSPNHRHSSTSDVGGREITVEAASLRALLDAHDLVTVDVLKMDIEGGEHDLIRDDPDALRRVGSLFAEVHGDDGARDGFAARLEALGFTIAMRNRHPEFGCETLAARA